MKRIAVLVMALILSLVLTACLSPQALRKLADAMEEKAVEQEESTPVLEGPETFAPAAAAETKPVETARPEKTPEDTESREFLKTAFIEEKVLVDEDGILIKVTGIEYDKTSLKLNFAFENNTDEDLKFRSVGGSSGEISINGYMAPSGYFDCNVAAGKKAVESLNLYYDELRLMGINEIADIEMSFDVQNNDYKVVRTIENIRIETSAVEKYDYGIAHYREAITSEELQRDLNYSVEYFVDAPLCSQNGFTVASCGFLKSKDDEPLILLEVVNNSGEPAYAKIGNIEINGLNVTSSYYSSNLIQDGKTAVLDFEPMNMLDENSWALFGVKDAESFAAEVQFVDMEQEEIGDPASIIACKPNAAAVIDREGEKLYDSNGLKITLKGIAKDSSSYSDAINIVLAVENNVGKEVHISMKYNSFSLNGMMADCLMDSVTAKDGGCAVLEIELWENHLKDVGLGDIEDIEDFELTLDIRDKRYNDVDKPTITYVVK